MTGKALAGLFVGLLLLAGCAGTADKQGSDAAETTIYAVGDIADCRHQPLAQAPAARTGQLLRQTTGTILALGDIAYQKGSYADFKNCFEPTWGGLKERILPAAGNHEYLTPGASDYFGYFGPVAGEAGKGYYGTHVGSWHVIALNSNIDMATGSEQERWLRGELAADNSRCTLVFWHHPLFASTARGNNPKIRAVWQTLYDSGVDVVLNGHEHLYERFALQTPDGIADPVRGIREFVVGTGGGDIDSFVAKQPNSEAGESGAFGVLELTLRKDGYSWKFLPAADASFTDSGEGKCHD